MSKICSKCASTHIIPNVKVLDWGTGSDGLLKVAVAEAPKALFFKRLHLSHLSANICGACGFTELFADEPELLYAAYLKSQDS
jgi:hypothetical protein